MELKEFIDSREVDFTKNVITIEDIEKIEKEIGVTFGGQLIRYILKYGYLAYKHVEMYGVNSKQLLESDLVKQTKYLHTYFQKTKSYIALENTGDGNYMIVSPEDEVYEYLSEYDILKDTGRKLFDYILARFEMVDESSVG